MRLIAILKSCLHPKSHPVTSAGEDIMYHSALTPSVFGKWEVHKKCESQTAKLFLNPWLLATCDNSQIQSFYDMVRSAKSIIYLTEWHIGLKSQPQSIPWFIINCYEFPRNISPYSRTISCQTPFDKKVHCQKSEALLAEAACTVAAWRSAIQESTWRRSISEKLCLRQQYVVWVKIQKRGAQTVPWNSWDLWMLISWFPQNMTISIICFDPSPYVLSNGES